MGTGYVRRSTTEIATGEVIEAADFNNEFNDIVSAFTASTGHSHDGTTAEGGNVTKLLGAAITIGDGSSGADIVLTFDGETTDGVLTWMEDEDHFKFSDDIVVDGTKRLYFNDEGGEYIHGDGTDLNLVSGADINIPASIGLTFGNDGEKIEGDGTDLTVSSSAVLTLDAGGGITIDADSGTITFADGGVSLGTITSSGYSGTAAVATTVTITDNESTDESNALIFTAGGDVDGGNLGLESDGTLTYNPSTGVVTATGFVGALTGNVTGNVSGTAATVTGAAQTNITSLGTLTALTVDDVAINGKVITMTGDTSDTVVFTAGAAGTLSIVTTDAAGAAGNIQITADGTVDIDSASTLTLDSGAAINLEPASGSAILLDGTISIDAGVVTGATSITSTVFVGDVTGDITGTADVATVATTVTITDNESTNENNAIVFTAGGDVDGGNLGLESDGTLTYNPSTGAVTATGFVGALTGNVTGNASGTAATVTGAAQTNITSLGTLTALTVDDVAVNGKVITMTGDTSDTVVFTAGAAGTLSIVTTDAAGADGNITITADGTFEADGTTITLDSAGDIDLNAGGGDIFFKEASTTFGSATNSSGELVLKSGTTTALTFSGANATLAGDLTISGDDLFMATNTSGHVLVADGTNYNPVAVSGDVTMAASGAVTIASTAVESGMLNNNIISGQTELASGLATTDEILVSDAGTIKRMDVSVIAEVTDASATALAIALG